jgi:hypothetical protein
MALESVKRPTDRRGEDVELGSSKTVRTPGPKLNSPGDFDRQIQFGNARISETCAGGMLQLVSARRLC